jgi:RNA polymerase sigma-70 factor (ECF subfamily)
VAGDKAVIYCVVPSGLARHLHQRLRDYFAHNPAVRLVVERRASERRAADSRRSSDVQVADELERRRVRAQRGRRVEERRGVLVTAEPLPLPPDLQLERERIRFFERVERSTLAREDADTARLIGRIQAGEEELYSEVYLRYFDRVYTYLRIALQDAAEAEDATQDVFIRVLRAIPRYERREVPFRAWLFRIVRNCAITRLRKRSRYTLQPPIALARESERNGAASAEDALLSIQDSELISLIERLPLGQRQVIALRYMLDLSSRDIAEIVGRTPAAVRQLHHRALEQLRNALEPPKEEDLGRQLGRVRRQPMSRIVRPSPVLRARKQVA